MDESNGEKLFGSTELVEVSWIHLSGKIIIETSLP